ncbi:hypothetical protein R6Q59_006719 [Mikania micrantha]
MTTIAPPLPEPIQKTRLLSAFIPEDSIFSHHHHRITGNNHRRRRKSIQFTKQQKDYSLQDQTHFTIENFQKKQRDIELMGESATRSSGSSKNKDGNSLKY